ncbi:MAG: zinc ribbon domain-containing protein [Dehalococcoidia bacterium]|nr:zinc ribbon domain-containing protein [Dehalococcoidia bacterium]
MPLYEYHCGSCKKTFERLLPMSRSSERATCPAGHAGAGRVVSLVARSWESNGPAAGAPAGGGCGSCAGGACACAAH